MDSPPYPAAVLRAGALEGVRFDGIGGAVAERLEELGATRGPGALIHRAATTDPRQALDDAWDAIRAHAVPPEAAGRLIVLIAPPPGDPRAAATRAGLENLARTLSIEWSRHGDPPGRDPPRHGHDRRRAGRARRLPRLARGRLLQRLRVHPSLAQGTSTESSVGESRATTYSAGSVAERLTTMCVSRGGT